MRTRAVSVVLGVLMATAVQAQAPLSEVQRAQVGQSLDALALGIARATRAHRDCAQRDTTEACAGEATQLEQMRVQQRSLCQQFTVPSGRHGCP